jgi:lysozyme family protein
MNSQARFERCLTFVLKHEGGYVDHPRDPGGATNMGITLATLSAHRGRTVTKQEVRDLTQAEAAAIYREKYWNVVRAGELPAGIDIVAFDPAVNSGPRRGARWLQEALVGQGLTVKVDGAVGTETLVAANSTARVGQAVDVIKRACAIRMSFLHRLSTFDAFGRGWTRRVADVEATGVRWALEARPLSREAVQSTLRQEAERAERAESQARTAAGTSTVAAPTSVIGLDQLADAPAWGTTGVLVTLAMVALSALMKLKQHQTRKMAYLRVVQAVLR